jgi:hypothetical protein
MGRAGERGGVSIGAEGTGLEMAFASDAELVSSLEVMADDPLDAVAEAVLSRNSLDRAGISLRLVGTASDVNPVNDAVVLLMNTVGAELVSLTAAVAVSDVGTGVLLLRKTVGTDGVTVAVRMAEGVLRAVVFSSGLLVRSKVVDEMRAGGDARTVVLGIKPTEVAMVGTVAIPVRLASSDDVALRGAARLVALAAAEDTMVDRVVRLVASVVGDGVPRGTV